MKYSLAVAAGLAVTASAFPVTVISLTGPVDANLAAGEVQVDETARPEGLKPCHGGPPPFAPPPHPMGRGPLGDLLARLGLLPPSNGHHHEYHSRPYVAVALKDEEERHRAAEEHGWKMLPTEEMGGWTKIDMPHRAEEWKHHMEEFVDEAEGKILPVLQRGSIKILPILNEKDEFAQPSETDGLKEKFHHEHHHHHHHEKMEEWKALEGKDGVKAHHHHGHHGHRGHRGQFRGKSFSCRLNRALRALTPTESIAMAFVLGAGVGSILHFVFMILLVTIRLARGGVSCAERRAARKARRAERKASKTGGQIKLQGEDVLPSYAEDDTDRLVEKAEISQ